jgi:hypothetical protein
MMSSPLFATSERSSLGMTLQNRAQRRRNAPAPQTPRHGRTGTEPGEMPCVLDAGRCHRCPGQRAPRASCIAERGGRCGDRVRDDPALWRGDAYAEFADEDWARPEAQRLAEVRLVAYERLVEAELAGGRSVTAPCTRSPRRSGRKHWACCARGCDDQRRRLVMFSRSERGSRRPPVVVRPLVGCFQRGHGLPPGRSHRRVPGAQRRRSPLA